MLYFLSDTHFNHANIIKYSKRPFKSVEEMNHFMLMNWIDSVTKDDEVIFVGDFAMGRYESLLHDVLKCRTVFIRGNHDKKFKPNGIQLHDNMTVTAEDGTPFYVVHEPEHVPRGYRGWVIHGHHHNNYPQMYPFFNPIQKTINVSVDMIGYRLVSMEDIMKLVKTQVTPVITRP